MNATSVVMKPSEAIEAARKAAAARGEWAGKGWNDSSWELMHGLEVVEDLPLDAWPLDGLPLSPSFNAPLTQPAPSRAPKTGPAR